MLNIKNIKIIFLIFFIFLPKLIFSYSIDTHAALTQEIIDFYNQHFDKKIPEALKNFLIDGARREDDFPRYFNHFYDPVYDRGLNDPIWGKGVAAKIWAQSEFSQNKLSVKIIQSIASILTAIQHKKIEDITFHTNYTWQKALDFYLKGDVEKAMFSLGHILHLIEDMGVPAHTRNDGHPAVLGDEETYEVWASRFNQDNIKKNINLKNKNPIILDSLDKYFENLSNYTNNNFYSNDTIGIQSGYDKPEMDYLEKIGDYFYGIKSDREFGDYKLFLKKSQGLFNNILSNNQDVVLFIPKKGGDLVLQDYWKLLSTKVIQNGAGVINLFFQEVENLRKNQNLNEQKQTNFLGQVFDSIKNFAFSIFNNQEQKNVEILNLDNFSNNSQTINNLNSNNSNLKKEEIYCDFNIKSQPLLKDVVFNEINWMGDFESPNNEWLELKNISKRDINLSGWQIIDKNQQIKIVFDDNKIIKANSFLVLKRNMDYTGALSNTDEVLRLFNKDCVLIDEVIAQSMWPAGSNKEKKTMERNKNLKWLTSQKVLGTPNLENSVYLLESEEIIETSTDKVNIKEENKIENEQKTKSLNLEKEDKDLLSINEKNNVKDINLVDTSSVIIKSPIKECSFQTDLKPLYKDLIINEIAWMGDFGSAQNEWLELKNVSGKDLNIFGYQLVDKNEDIKIIFNDFIIPKDKFILLKRSPGNFLQSIEADFIYKGSLNNTNEGLRLFDKNCVLLDEVFAENGWSFGDNKTKQTMERKNDLNWQTSLNVYGTPRSENSLGEQLNSSRGSGVSGISINNSNNQSQINYPKILINEIKIAPINERFIELYNPNDFEVNLTNWYLQRKTKTSDFTSLVSKTYFESKVIPAKGFILIARSNLNGADIILNNLTLSDNNVIQLKNPLGEVVDKVGWGEIDIYETQAFNNFSFYSIQRKIENNNFIDTDNNFNDFELLLCASPKAISGNCVNNNEDNKILGNLAAKIVISEIQLEGLNEGDEFIELYNPLDVDIDLSDYSIQYKSNQNENFSSSTIFKKNFEKGQIIKSKSFFLIARGLNEDLTDGYLGLKLPDLTYRGFSLSSRNPGGTVFLVNNQEIIESFDDENIVDFIDYQSLILNYQGGSFERKTFLAGFCYKAQDEYEFLGNGCLENRSDFFDFREKPNPQNSFSFSEPRLAPTNIENFDIVYNSSTLELIFNWLPSYDYLNSSVVYEIYLFNDNLNKYELYQTTTDNFFRKRIYEIGKNYKFSIKAIDLEGLASNQVEKEIYLPSFFKKVYFYKKNYKGADYYLIDIFYENYPFVNYDPDLGKALVFYLNQENISPLTTFSYYEYKHYYVNYKKIESSSIITYQPCYSSEIFNPNYSRTLSFVPLPPTSTFFCSYGFYSDFYNSEALNLNHIFLFFNAPYELSENDYLNIVFYTQQPAYGYFPNDIYFDLLALDKTKYFFEENPDYLINFIENVNLSYEILNKNLELNKAQVKIKWDVLDLNNVFLVDNNLFARYSFDNENWQTIYLNELTLDVNLNESYTFYLQFFDNLNRNSEIYQLNIFVADD